MTLLEAVDILPPPVVRAIARRSRKGGGGQTDPLTTSDIAVLSGVPVGEVRYYLAKKTWKTCPVGVASAILLVALTHVEFSCSCRRQRAYIAATAKKSWPLAHLSKVPKRDRDRILKRLN